ncbi:unnamed protein product, partial [Meganyctiphanes norvegica]
MLFAPRLFSTKMPSTGNTNRENLYERQSDWETTSSTATTPGEVMLMTAITPSTEDVLNTTDMQTNAPELQEATQINPVASIETTPLTVQHSDVNVALSSSPLSGSLGPPPAYSAFPPRLGPTAGAAPGPPPSYDECHNPNAPPPSYESLFGRVREVHKTSSGILDFVKNILILLLGTSK